jgi:hypothetical protein
MKKIVALLVVLMLTISSSVYANESTGNTEQPSTINKAADIIIVRPLAASVSVITTALYVVIAIPTHIMGYSEEAADVLVTSPWRFTGCRPMGVYDRCKDGTEVIK